MLGKKHEEPITSFCYEYNMCMFVVGRGSMFMMACWREGGSECVKTGL